MGHYKANLRDLEFTLFEVFGRGEVLGTGPYADVDEETARSILAEVERLATEELAPSLTDSDRNPPTFDPATGEVRLPESFKKSYHAFMDAEWWRLLVPSELGGTTVPPTLRWAFAELVLGANPAVWMYAAGASFASVVWHLGTDEQKQIARHMIERRWGATMVLTEPDAGSDVGAGRARAYPQPDGTWHLEGVKRFITSGDHDLSENVVHLVLARPVGVEGAGGPGTKGLSLFVVPKLTFDLPTGRPGEPNGVQVTNVEKKMGLKVSTTCELTFGARHPAVGYLLGGVHDGIAQMFKVIEYARMMVGTKAIATLSTGYLNALEFAKERVQGADMLQMTDRTAPRVTITHHPEVRRSLLMQKAYAEGMRALVVYTALQQDAVDLALARGETDEAAERVNDLLLPVVKGFGSERSYALLADALQILGGSGYLQEYPLEQYIRDAKIDTLYEGTTAIQGLDLFFRKIVKDQGRALTTLMTDIGQFVKDEAGNGALAHERELLAAAAEDVQGIVGVMVGRLTSTSEDPRNLYTVGQDCTRLLMALGELVTGWLLLRQAEVAAAKVDGAAGRDKAFYEGKVAAARFFARQVFPTLAAQRSIAEGTDNALMDLPEEAF